MFIRRPEKSCGPYTICGVDITGTIGLCFADETGAGSTTGSMYTTGVESLSMTESTNVSGTVSTNEMGTGATAASTCTVGAGSSSVAVVGLSGVTRLALTGTGAVGM